jgi:hypothetical protein
VLPALKRTDAFLTDGSSKTATCTKLWRCLKGIAGEATEVALLFEAFCRTRRKKKSPLARTGGRVREKASQPTRRFSAAVLPRFAISS